MAHKLVKTEKDYEEAIAKANELIDLDPNPETSEANELELLSLLIEDYESKKTTFALPNPVEAIKFRMEQQNLIQRDLVPFIGSRSKVSEVLSGKRPLSLPMIRSLSENLGIPANVLLQDYKSSQQGEMDVNWERFPVKEMISRGWIDVTYSDSLNTIKEALQNFLEPAPLNLKAVLFRKTAHLRSERPLDEYALTAWTARVVRKANENPPDKRYVSDSVNLEFLHGIAKLSVDSEGPILAAKALAKKGIAVVVEPHLPRTHLDGAAILSQPEMPIVAMTIRFDRIDYFWFTLMHELAHIVLHQSTYEFDQFYDDLELTEDLTDLDEIEIEADNFAQEALIPNVIWSASPASRLRTAEAAEDLAKKLNVHTAIVAGRIRYETKAYKKLNNLVGHREVRKLFNDKGWETYE